MRRERSTAGAGRDDRRWQRQEVWYLLAAALSSAGLFLAAGGILTGFAFVILLIATLVFGIGLLLQSAPSDIDQV